MSHCSLRPGLAYIDQVRAKISEAAKQQLLYDKDSTKRYQQQIAHDLGTPLQGLQLVFSEASAAHNSGTPTRSSRYSPESFQHNMRAGQTCFNTIVQLRDSMMVEAKLHLGQRLLPKPAKFDPIDVLDGVYAMMEGKAKASEVALYFDLPARYPLWHIVSDPRWLASMTINLTSNAIKHARARVRVVVSLSFCDDSDAKALSTLHSSEMWDGVGDEPTLVNRHQRCSSRGHKTAGKSTKNEPSAASESAGASATTKNPLRNTRPSTPKIRDAAKQATLRVTVHDDGQGIPPSLSDTLFRMYGGGRSHLDRDGGRDGGTGIGLYSVKVQCKSLGGQCGFAKSNLLGGAAVWFEIPFRTTDGNDATSEGREHSPGKNGVDSKEVDVVRPSADEEEEPTSTALVLTSTALVTPAPPEMVGPPAIRRLPLSFDAINEDGTNATSPSKVPWRTPPRDISNAAAEAASFRDKVRRWNSKDQADTGAFSDNEDEDEDEDEDELNLFGGDVKPRPSSPRTPPRRPGSALAELSPGSRPIASPPRRSASAPPATECILLVDDCPIILLMVSALLEKNGLEVHKAMNGREALKRMQERDYDLGTKRREEKRREEKEQSFTRVCCVLCAVRCVMCDVRSALCAMFTRVLYYAYVDPGVPLLLFLFFFPLLPLLLPQS